MFAHRSVRARSRSARHPSKPDSGFTAIEVLVVCAVVATLGALAAPMMGNMLGYYRLTGDARAILNSLATSKMRAASSFTQTRLFVSPGARTFHIEQWRKTGTPGWVTEGATMALSGSGAF